MTPNSKIVAGICIAIIGLAAMPADAKTINLSCYAGNASLTSTASYRIDLDARTTTMTSSGGGFHGQVTNHADDISYPISEIDDQYVVWEEMSNGQIAGYWQIDRATLLLSYRNVGVAAYTPQMQCKILNNQF